MLDVLLAIKNNNMKKIPQYDPTHVEHLKKVMKPLIRKGNSVTQFNITLEDLLQGMVYCTRDNNFPRVYISVFYFLN